MNKHQKLVQQQFLNDEEKIIKRLKSVYGQSLKDINGKVATLDSSISQLQKALADVGEDEIGELAAAYFKGKAHITPEEAKETLQSMLQSKVYQKKYQEALKKQVGGVLDTMQDKEFKAVSDYLTECYENGFIGTMYDLQGQGIPMCFPLDQEAMVRAVQLDSKISQGLYSRLGEDIAVLKKKITAQVSRGISTGMSYQQVAQQLAGVTNIGFNNAVRIARTEGHRIQCQSGMDACYKAKEKGANVVKQWDAALDSRTRESHMWVDGEIRELDEKFSNGLMFPGDPAGGAAEVVNCRCALLQRAKWALDEDELQALKDRAAYYGLDKTANFEDYKQKYLKAADDLSEVEEIKDAIDFAYGNYTDDDYIKWMDAYDKHNSGVHLNDKELKIIDDYTEGSFIGLNDVNRYSDSQLLKKGYSTEDIARIRKNAETLDGALSKYDLDTDIVTHRFERDVSWLTGNGNGIEELEGLVGTEYTAKGFTSSGMLPNRFRFTGRKADAVHFEIVTPKGTNGAFLSMSKKGENEFLYNRNTRFKILDGGERVVKERKLNIRTMKMEDVEITERFLKVQVIPDKIYTSAKISSQMDDIITVKKCRSFDDLSKHLSKTYNISVDDAVKQLDFESCRTALTGVESMLDEFDVLKDRISKITTSKSGFMSCSTDGVISFNPVSFADAKKVAKTFADQIASGYWVRNSSTASVGVHETSHLLEWILIETSGKYPNRWEKMAAWNGCKEAKEIVSQACKNMKKTEFGKGRTYAEMRRTISGYATTDYSEALADSFEDVYANGANASPLAIEIRRLTIEKLKQYGG